MKYSKFIAGFLILSLCLSVVLTAKPVTAEAVSLTMWTWKQFHMPGLEALAKDYADKTGVQVTFNVFNPDDAYKAKVTSSAQSGDLPDLLAWWAGGNRDGQWDLAAADILLDITKDVDATWAKSFLPGTYEKSSVWTQKDFDACAGDKNCAKSNLKVGQVFSVPLAAGSFYIIYANAQMLKAAGLDPNVTPKDTVEFLDMLSKVNTATGKGITVGGKFSDILRNWFVNGLAISNCGPKKYSDMISGADGVSFTDQCVVDAFKVIADMSAKKVWQPGFQQLTIDQADIEFAKGNAAFDIGGSFTLGFLLQQGMKAEDIRLFALPALPTSLEKPIKLAPFALIDVGVTKNSKHPAEATAFLKYLTSADAMAKFAKITGELPAAKISSDVEVVGPIMAGLAAAYAGSETAMQASPDWAPQGDTVWTALDTAANKLVTGEATESSLPDLLKAADDAAKFDRSQRGN